MRTRRDLEIEARRLDQLAIQSLENSRTTVPNTDSGRSGPRQLFVFPETTVRINSASESEGPLTHRMLRSIAAVSTGPRVEFSLVEEEFVSDQNGQLVQHYDPIDLVKSDEAIEVLSAGFQRLDEDLLRERIEPIVDRIEATSSTHSVEAEDIAELEQLASDFALSAATRMRLKADAVDLLEGRLEPGEFVARTVSRQECFQVGERFAVSRQITESQEI